MTTHAATDRCYWTDIARDVDFGSEPLHRDIDLDVAIIGGGIVGIVAARLLKDRGQRVAVVEAGRVGHGVTGRSTAKVTAQHAVHLQRIEQDRGAEAARAYAGANRIGVELIDELTRRYNLACDLEPADSWVYAVSEDGAGQLEAEQAAAERAGLPMEIVRDTELPYPVRAGLRLANQRQFQPADFVAQLSTTLPGDGSFVFEHSLATDWSENKVCTERSASDHGDPSAARSGRTISCPHQSAHTCNYGRSR